MNRYLAMLLSIFALLWLPACSTTAAPADLGCNQAVNTCLQGTARVALNTDKGQVLIELDGKNAP